MKLSRLLLVSIFITCFSLLYVYQQVEIFRLAYAGQNKLARYQDLLDKNSFLRYNLKRNTSLVCIGNKISRNADFQMPNSYRLVRLASSVKGLKLKEGSLPKETILTRIFGIKRQAEAKTINP